MMRITFHGAAGTVTGSKYLVEVNDKSILVDCGMFQGPRELRLRNWKPVPFDVKSLSAIVLTHAHIDHIGFLPKVVKEGFSGPVYATPPTVDLAHVSLMDAAHLQMEDAAYRAKKKASRHKVVLPLFDTDDAELARKHLSKIEFDEWVTIGDEFRWRYHVVGHLLGAAMVELELNDGKEKKTLLFSGDVGRYGNPLTKNPSEPPKCDYLICESTYGGRVHPAEDAMSAFENIVKETIEKKSVLLIPAFSIGRTQQITYMINRLIERDFIPPINIHIDSPMAIAATEIYTRYPDYQDDDLEKLGGAKEVLNGENVYMHRTRKASQRLNEITGPAIIMSASGMLTGGRILHHMINRLPDPTTTVALVGFMAEGTLGRKLVEGDKVLYIHKQPVPVKARIVQFNGLSGHADYQELLHWLEPLVNTSRRVFVTHGEKSQSEAMAEHLREEHNWNPVLPEMDQSFEL